MTSWEGGVPSMEVTSVSEAGWGAKPAEELVEGLALTVEVIGRPVEGEALGSVMGGVSVRRQENLQTSGWETVFWRCWEQRGRWRVASVSDDTQALVCKGSPSPTFREGSKFALK